MATGKVAARAGEQYDLYAYIQGELDADTTQGRFLIRAKFMDSNGASLGYSDITAMYPGAISSWTRVGGRVTAPANSVSMQVQYLLYQSSGWVNIDDVEVTIVAPNAATEVTKYYYFGGQRVAMRKNGVLTYLHTDHLGSTVLETNASGAIVSDEKYKAFGKQRDSGAVSTDHRFTGQKEDGSGLMYYSARYYDPLTGMFVSPDTIVPDVGNVFDYNRFMYVRGRVMSASDPSGHSCMFVDGKIECVPDQIGGETVTIDTSYTEYSWQSAQLGEQAHQDRIELAQDIIETVLPNEGASSFGVNGSAGIGLDVVGNIGIVYVDSQGNMQVGGASLGIGGNTGANVDVGMYFNHMETASSVNIYDGYTVNGGISGGEVIGVTVERNATRDSQTNQLCMTNEK